MKFFIFFLSFLVIPSVFAQNSNEIYYNQFDAIVHSYESDLNTGQRFEDLFLTISDDEFRFFVKTESTVGTVNYNGQQFYKAALRYDLLEDNLLFKDLNGTNQYDIILDHTLVNSFSILGRDFERLPEKAAKLSFYKNGFFEVLSRTKDFSLYVKHTKSKSMKLGDKKSYYIYSKTENIVMEYRSEFYEISNRNDIIRILPERKQDIKSFYKNYGYLESQNKIEFMKKLISALSQQN